MAFRTYKASDQFNFVGWSLYNSGSSSAFYEAPLPLPNGASITKFVVYYYDNDASNLSATLHRAAFDKLFGTTMANVTSSGTGDFVRYGEDISIDVPIIDQQSYYYWVEVSLPPTSFVQLVGVRVDYGYPNNLPLVQK
jgi:hypothetical protein